MIIILVLLVLPIPLRIFKDNFFDLLFSSPPKEIVQTIEKHIEAEFNVFEIKDYYLRTAKSGRFYSIHISILLKISKSNLTEKMDLVRSRLDSLINKDIPNSMITIETTNDRTIYQQINEQ